MLLHVPVRSVLDLRAFQSGSNEDFYKHKKKAAAGGMPVSTTLSKDHFHRAFRSWIAGDD